MRIDKIFYLASGFFVINIILSINLFSVINNSQNVINELQKTVRFQNEAENLILTQD